MAGGFVVEAVAVTAFELGSFCDESMQVERSQSLGGVEAVVASVRLPTFW
jgi:hypothetical protein